MNSPHNVPAGNKTIAEHFREAARLVEQQGASPFRVAAYRKGADSVETLDGDIRDVASQGLEALEALPQFGRGLAAAIMEIVDRGHWVQLDRLRGSSEPETVFQAIRGIGPVLVRAIHDALHADTLEALEVAAHDGRLASLPGIGPRRAAAIRHALSAMLSRRRALPGAGSDAAEAELPAGMLLDVEREYRDKAGKGSLQLIAPKRFNPEAKAWLPILHTERPPWHFTVLYSNTARPMSLEGPSTGW